MQKTLFLYSGFVLLLLSSCIKDDFVDDEVDPILRITSLVDSIAINTTFQFEYMYLNNIGTEESVEAVWSSSNEDVISISSLGLANALNEGSSTISISYDSMQLKLEDSFEVIVGATTVLEEIIIEGSIQTTSSYKLEGDFAITEEENGIKIDFKENYSASTALPGLYVYLSNNRNSIANAFEIGAVDVFSGEHSYFVDDAGINDYSYLVYFCKPFNVKVGDGQIQ